MEPPKLSKHFQNRLPSDIRCAQIEFQKREDKVDAVNVAIGNVSLPMHPLMQERAKNLISDNSPFQDILPPQAWKKQTRHFLT